MKNKSITRRKYNRYGERADSYSMGLRAQWSGKAYRLDAGHVTYVKSDSDRERERRILKALVI